MVDVSAIGEGILSVHPSKCDGPDVKKLKLPKHLEYAAKHTVSYSDLDVNAHLNNVKVSDIICNALKLETAMEGKYVSEFQIGYLKESKPGDELILSVSASDEGIYAAGECGGEQRFESFFVLTQLSG